MAIDTVIIAPARPTQTKPQILPNVHDGDFYLVPETSSITGYRVFEVRRPETGAPSLQLKERADGEQWTRAAVREVMSEYLEAFEAAQKKATHDVKPQYLTPSMSEILKAAIAERFAPVESV